MKRLLLSLIALLALSCTLHAQLLSYTLQDSYSRDQLDTLLEQVGFSTILAPVYGVDIYQVIYETPYRSEDTLVRASAAVAIPQGAACGSPIACYSHGTTTDSRNTPSRGSAERNIGLFFAGLGGVATVMPDGLGLGTFDTSVPVHPYINYFHAGRTGVDAIRAARQLADTLQFALNGEVVLTGYSQGGYDAAAINKMIQTDFSSEFNLVAAAPMSGPYDLNVTMLELMLSPDPYSAPGYLPFLLLGNWQVDSSLQAAFPTPSHIFKPPFDTLLPPLFYDKNNGLGTICAQCPQVPRDMIIDSVINAVQNDTNHIVRKFLAENDLLGWAPQNPVKLQYCNGDEQVPFENSVQADSAWKAQGAPDVLSEDFGNKSHGDCVEPALLSTALFLLSKVSTCTSVPELQQFDFTLFPNPSNGRIAIQKPAGLHQVRVFNQMGSLVHSSSLLEETSTIELHELGRGHYLLQLEDEAGASSWQQLLIR